MNARAAIPADPPAPDATEAFARPLLERQALRLERLAEIGMRIAEACAGRAEEPSESETPAPARDAALAFARVSRAVRLTCALQSKSIEALRDLDRPREGADDTALRFLHAEDRKARVERIVLRQVLAEADARSEARAERAPAAESESEPALDGDEPDDGLDAIQALMVDVGETLDDGVHGDVTARPLRDTVADICRDLKLSPDWSRLDREGWARAEAAGETGPSLRVRMAMRDFSGGHPPRWRVSRPLGEPAEEADARAGPRPGMARAERQLIRSAVKILEATEPLLDRAPGPS
jgi:hypothetical protein